MISIDIMANTIQVKISDEELARRRAQWKPKHPKITTGYLARYAALVTSGNRGAVLDVNQLNKKTVPGYVRSRVLGSERSATTGRCCTATAPGYWQGTHRADTF